MVNNTLPTIGIGTHYPNRLFVGSLPGSASANDLAEFFKKFGTVLEGKVVLDCNGNSRRFGFITFATNDDVQRVLGQGCIFFRGKKINVGPAVKRMMPDGQPSMLFSPDPAKGNSGSFNRSQICELRPLIDPTTPPVSPASPMSGQKVFFRMDQVQQETPPQPPPPPPQSLNLPAAQPYTISCAGIPLHTNVTNFHLPCQSQCHSPIAPSQGQFFSASRYTLTTTVVPYQNARLSLPISATAAAKYIVSRTPCLTQM
ncbi:protein boule-like [Rhopilema esculentum]|uniref:protein boule-like n=1 Tax=Rhopilema esculentum TaxID=499914 RepID=UPI0031D0F43D